MEVESPEPLLDEEGGRASERAENESSEVPCDGELDRTEEEMEAGEVLGSLMTAFRGAVAGGEAEERRLGKGGHGAMLGVVEWNLRVVKMVLVQMVEE